MSISRSNYEIWFTDWLDSNLSKSELEQLRIFLSENPDLKEEFEELGRLRLDPPSLHMPFREGLKKSAEDLPDSQFDVLCVAYHENDLSEQQKNDFLEMIADDKKRQEIFSLSGKLRLRPPNDKFSSKNSLLRRSRAGKFLRIAAPVLSVAAMIALALLLIKPEGSMMPGITLSDPVEIQYDSSLRLQPATHPSLATAETPAQPSKTLIDSNDAVPTGINRVTEITRPVLSTSPDLSVKMTDNALIALQAVSLPEERTDEAAGQYDARNRVQRLLAFKFREKILKEDLPDTSPIDRFDIAEAGINGLNKLFGWEMQLDKDNETGEGGTVNFSSRLVQFSAPVKKNETSE
jgi:hypothetical protein